MKVEEFLSNRDPGDESVLADSATSPTASDGDETEHVEDTDFQHVTSLTPSGLEVLYSWAPKRLYRVRNTVITYPAQYEWRDVPSVTSVLGILDKSGPIGWWSQGVGIDGLLTLADNGTILFDEGVPYLGNEVGVVLDKDDIVKLLTRAKLTCNHIKDKAADRGTNVHGALESWAIDQTYRANPDLYEEHERGYIVGLNKFLDDLGRVTNVEAEVMVGSLEEGFAGRYDLRFTLPSDRELVTKTYPKRADKREVVLPGRVLCDLKTSKSVYPTHGLQLAAYELASIECGYGATDYRAVIHVTSEGKYEFVRTHAQPGDFLSILQAYNTMQGAKSWL